MDGGPLNSLLTHIKRNFSFTTRTLNKDGCDSKNLLNFAKNVENLQEDVDVSKLIVSSKEFLSQNIHEAAGK